MSNYKTGGLQTAATAKEISGKEPDELPNSRELKILAEANER